MAPEIRADFTVKGADVDALLAEARTVADVLAGPNRLAELVKLYVEVDSRIEPGGTITVWRAEVEARIVARPPDHDQDEEPF
jgi:hypothetical protein